MSPMRRPIALLALWLTAAIACTTLGWLTVGIVSGQARESSLPPLTPTTTTHDDAEAGAVGPQSAIAPGSTATTSTSTSTSTTTTTAPGAPLEAPPPADDAEPAVGAAPPVAPPPQATAAAPLPRAPAPTTVAALPAPPPAPAPTTSDTIISRGGSVAVRYDGSTETVSLLWASPSDGFTMDVQDTGPDKVEVRFESDDAESRVFAWWDGAPQQRVEERD